MRKGFHASRIFTGDEWLDDMVVIVNDGIVEKLVTKDNVQDIEIRSFADGMIVPAFIDLQVYGAAKRLLAVYPEPSTLQLMYEEFSKKGTVLFLPTAATNTIEVFKKCIDAVREYWNLGGKGVPGLHLEGPWLNETKRGAHVKEWIHPPTMEEVKDLLDYGKGVIKMITIAPEVCSEEVIQFILSNNIIISAGHSNSSYEEATKAFDNGVSAVTHLYNAMSPLQHRAPGLVGAAFNHQEVRSSIIPDGHHVDYAALRIAKNLMGERLFAITDAVTETTSGPYQHQLAGDKYECNGVLSGSALSMHQAFMNLIQHAGIETTEALRMCSTYPAKVLACDDRYGKIVPQAAGQFLVLNKQLGLEEVILL
jgi:N-acetylglucosamine-6-phosphate deacetylase